MCSTPYDCHYSAYGGSTPRGDRVHGRVGSAFRDASAWSVSQPPGIMDDGVYSETYSDEYPGDYGSGYSGDGEEVYPGRILDEGSVNDGVIQHHGSPGMPHSSMPSDSTVIELPGQETLPAPRSWSPASSYQDGRPAPLHRNHDTLESPLDGLESTSDPLADSHVLQAIPQDLPLNRGDVRVPSRIRRATFNTR